MSGPLADGFISRRSAWWLAAFFLLSLFCDELAIHLVATQPAGDELDYHLLAVNLIGGAGFAIEPGHSVAFRPPLYPVFLAGIYALFGSHYEAAWHVQAALNSGMVVLVYLLGRRFFSESIALCGAGLYAVYPTFDIVTQLHRENLLVPLFAGCLYALVAGIQERRSRWFWCAGVLAGALTLTNSAFLYLPVGFLLLGLLDRRMRPYVGRVAGLLVIAFLLAAPWQVRNHSLPGASQEIAEFQQVVLMFGHYPLFAGRYWWTVGDMRQLERERDEARAFLRDRARDAANLSWEERLAKDRRDLRERILARPGRYAQLVFNRLLILLGSPPPGTSFVREQSPALAGALFVANLGFVGGALALLLRTYRRDASAWPLVAGVVYCLVVFGLTHSIRRYGYVLTPLWCVYAAGVMNYLRAPIGAADGETDAAR